MTTIVVVVINIYIYNYYLSGHFKMPYGRSDCPIKQEAAQLEPAASFSCTSPRHLAHLSRDGKGWRGAPEGDNDFTPEVTAPLPLLAAIT